MNTKRSVLQEQVYQNLLKLQDKVYQKFTQKLIPNEKNILGVRLPDLKRLAKTMSLTEEGKSFLLETPTYFEETMLQGLIITHLIKKKQDFELIKDFVPKITNWAVCDAFCTHLKIIKIYPKYTFNFILPYLKSSKEYDLRFALVVLLIYFVNKDYLSEIFKILDDFKSKDYYASMGAAWLLSVCYLKCKRRTMSYLKKSKLDDVTFNKGIQKMIESKTLTPDEQKNLKKLKRKINKKV